VKAAAIADMADTVVVATEEAAATEEAVEIAEVATETDNRTN
jgi:hypothetical protein